MRENIQDWLNVIHAGVLLVVIVGVGIHYWWVWRSQHPYGWSPSHDNGLWMALYLYASTHDGNYPAGEATPEASLCVLYPKFTSAEVLHRKTTPLDVVRAILERGDRLDPANCGWHYVEGLRSDDDPGLALCWDRTGLGHKGEQLRDGGHYVIFIGSGIQYISGAEWEAFLEEQEKLLVECKKKRLQQK